MLRLVPLPLLLSAVLTLAGCGGDGDNGAAPPTQASAPAATTTTTRQPPATTGDLGVSEPEIETTTAPRTTPKPSVEPTPDHEAGDQGQNQDQGAGNRDDEGGRNDNDPKARAIARCRADRAQQPSRFRTRYGSGPRGLAACVVDRAARDVAAGQGNG